MEKAHQSIQLLVFHRTLDGLFVLEGRPLLENGQVSGIARVISLDFASVTEPGLGW